MFKSTYTHIYQAPYLAVHRKSVSRPRGCRRRNTKTRKRENPKTAETPSTKTGKNENAKTAKTRKRENGKNAKSRKAVFCRKQKNTTINYRTSNQRRTEMGKAPKDGNAKTRKRQKVFSFSSCLVLHRSSPFRSTLNTKVITALGICKVCTEAVHSVALWTRTLSQLWARVSYVPKQSIP